MGGSGVSIERSAKGRSHAVGPILTTVCRPGSWFTESCPKDQRSATFRAAALGVDVQWARARWSPGGGLAVLRVSLTNPTGCCVPQFRLRRVEADHQPALVFRSPRRVSNEQSPGGKLPR